MTITITISDSDSDLPESDLLDPRRPGNHIVQMMFLQCLFFPAVMLMLMLMLMFLMLLMLMFLQEQIHVSIDVDDDCRISPFRRFCVDFLVALHRSLVIIVGSTWWCES